MSKAKRPRVYAGAQSLVLRVGADYLFMPQKGRKLILAATISRPPTSFTSARTGEYAARGACQARSSVTRAKADVVIFEADARRCRYLVTLGDKVLWIRDGMDRHSGRHR